MRRCLVEINNMTDEEMDKVFPEEKCPKHGAYRGVCMKCEMEWEAWVSRQEANAEFGKACRRDK